LKQSIRNYLIINIILVIAVVVGGVILFSYLSAKEDILYENEIMQAYSEKNIIESVDLVNDGLKLIDDTLNSDTEKLLQQYLDAYNRSSASPENMDLEALSSTFSKEINRTVNLYIFNTEGVIVYTNEPHVKGLDTGKQYPEFYKSLTSVRLGTHSVKDRVVHSAQGLNDSTVSGELTKFGYIPTPDHQFVLEIGIKSEEFADSRTQLSYQEMIDKIGKINADINKIQVYTIYQYCSAEWYAKGSTVKQNTTPSPLIQKAIEDRSYLSEISNDSGNLIKYQFIDLKDPNAVSDDSIVVVIEYGKERRESLLQGLIVRFIGLSFFAILAAFILAFIISKRISISIKTIMDDVRRIAGGDLDHTIRGMNTDEFFDLQLSINQMIGKIKQYSEELERKRAELQVASHIQQAILPTNISIPEGYDLAAINIPAQDVGGDFFDIFSREKGTCTLVLADVAGKGVPAALLMALSSTIIRVLSRWSKKPLEILQASNNIFIEDSGTVSFITMFYAVLDISGSRLQYVNAGHNPPVLYRCDGSFEMLDSNGPVIGLMDTASYDQKSIDLHAGDVLVIYSDGVTEAMNSKGIMFSEEHLCKVICEYHEKSASDIIQVILQEIHEFIKEEPQSDDITIMILKKISQRMYKEDSNY
jgi:serine phosphatase RsbU (regulator of sigma subunit)